MFKTPTAPRFAVLLVAFLFAASPVAAQGVHPNHAQGFEPQKAYSLGEIESVNLFNANLTLTLPLGPTYPVGGQLSYGLTLVYTGNVWEWDEEQHQPTGTWYLKAVPRRRSNAGLGWLLSLGRIYHPMAPETPNSQQIQYESPDGALHELGSPTLHPGTGPSDVDVRYTQDGTYLRYRKSTRELEFPDGAIHAFDATGRLTQIRDRFGNSLAVTYPASGYSGIQDWRLADSHGRVHYVRFRPGAAHDTGPVVDKVELEAFGDTTAVYDLTTQTRTITRGWTYAPAYAPPPDGYGVARQVSVSLLTQVLQPDGSTYSMPVTSSYSTGPGSGTDSRSGHLLRLGLPTGGFFEYSWQQVLFPTRSGFFQPLSQIGGETQATNPFTQSTGLATRRHETRGGSLLGQWTYTPTLDSGVPSKEHKMRVTDPLGHYTDHYFSAYVYSPEDPISYPAVSNWKQGEYGLPFTRNTSAAGLFLSSHTFASNGVHHLGRYVTYERDGTDPVTRANPRLSAERTYYKTDNSRYLGVTYSNWDGVGHYRTATTNGDFSTGGNVRTTHTEYNPGATATHQPATNSPWLLNTYTFRQVTENSVTAHVETCFDATTGVLTRERILENTGTTRSADDIVRVYLRYGSGSGNGRPGDLQRESVYGGDTQTVGTGTGTLCSLSLPSSPEHQMDHTWQYGTLKTSQVLGVTERAVDRLIDQSTGLVSRTIDPAFEATDYTYDTTGRLTWTKPADDSWREVTYRHGGSLAPQVIVYGRANGGGTVRTEERYTFDDLGRLSNHETRMPDGPYSDQTTAYDAAGNVRSVTTRGDATKKTEYLYFDPMGRFGTVRPPDSTSANGYAHDVVYNRKGVREIVRTVSVGTGWNGSAVTETPSTTRELYDGQGRLVQVVEPSNPDGTDSTTSYVYDVGNRLKTVTQVAKNGATSYTQTRTFTYDQRGFLLSEKHPEKGTSGNGTVTYSGYDPLGNPGRRLDGPHDLLYVYDAASRLTEVREAGVGGRTLQAFVYGTGNGTGDQRRGKLWKTTSYNHPVIGIQGYTITVDETYKYGGRQGRPSQRDTSVVITADGQVPGAADVFSQTWTWNDLGAVESQTYPQCTVAARCSAPSPRTVSYGYTRGQLTSIPGLVDSITYHPNGQPNVVDRANNTVDVWHKDASNLPRPAKIEGRVGTATGTVQWSTGQYVFDGAGNLVRLGTGYALHDAVSRVKSGAFSLGVTSNGTPTATWSTGYDGFGNIQSIATATSRNTPTSSSTNRLTGSVAYDGAGNMTSWNGASYKYDALDRTWSITNGSQDWRHTYTADGERVFSYNTSGPSRWTLRDLDGKVLREYENAGGTWSVVKDYVYRGSHAIAAYTRDASPQNLTHLHTDHLGTVRAVTDGNGTRIAYHVFYPFGEEATAISQSTERLKFTGHERDLGSPGSAADDIDYMHARYYNAQIGRFLGVDPGKDWKAKQPQSWNWLAYTRNNPLKYIDPNGRVVWLANRPVEAFPGANHAFIVIRPSGSNREIYANRMDERGQIVLSGGPGVGRD